MWFRDELELQVEELQARAPIEERIGGFKFMQSERISCSESNSLSSRGSDSLSDAGTPGCIGRWPKFDQRMSFQANNTLEMEKPLLVAAFGHSSNKWTQRKLEKANSTEQHCKIQFTRARDLSSVLVKEGQSEDKPAVGRRSQDCFEDTDNKRCNLGLEQEEQTSVQSMSQLRKLKKSNNARDHQRLGGSGFKTRLHDELDKITLGLGDIQSKQSPQDRRSGGEGQVFREAESPFTKLERMFTPVRPNFAEEMPGIRQAGQTIEIARQLDLSSGSRSEYQPPSQGQGRKSQFNWNSHYNRVFLSAGLTPKPSCDLGVNSPAPRSVAQRSSQSIHHEQMFSAAGSAHRITAEQGVDSPKAQPRKRNSWALRREQSLERKLAEREEQIQRNLEQSQLLLEQLQAKAAQLAAIEERLGKYGSPSRRNKSMEAELELVMASRDRHSKRISGLQGQIEELRGRLGEKERLAGETREVLRDSVSKRVQLQHSLLRSAVQGPLTAYLLLDRNRPAPRPADSLRTLTELELAVFDKVFAAESEQSDSAKGETQRPVELLFHGQLAPMVGAVVFHCGKPLTVMAVGPGSRRTVVGGGSPSAACPGLLQLVAGTMLECVGLLPDTRDDSKDTAALQGGRDEVHLSCLDVLEDDIKDVFSVEHLRSGKTEGGSLTHLMQSIQAAVTQRGRVGLIPRPIKKSIRSVSNLQEVLASLESTPTPADHVARVYRLSSQHAAGDAHSRILVNVVQMTYRTTDENKDVKNQALTPAKKKSAADHASSPITPLTQVKQSGKSTFFEVSPPRTIMKSPFGNQVENSLLVQKRENQQVNKLKVVASRNLDSKQVGEAIGGKCDEYGHRGWGESTGKGKSPLSAKSGAVQQKTYSILARVLRSVKNAQDDAKGTDSHPKIIHAPFRESKLTMLIQDSLNGLGETALVLTLESNSSTGERGLQIINNSAMFTILDALKPKSSLGPRVPTRNRY